MAINISKLNNISNLELNTSSINKEPSELLTGIVENANATSSGWLGLILLTVIFLLLSYEFIRNDGYFRLDTVRGINKAAGWAFIFGIISVVSQLITSFKPVVWFGTIWLISGIASIFLKRKNL